MTTGLKHGLLKPAALKKATRVMEELNAGASEVMLKRGAHACTDVTGFGFLGHALEMARAGGVDLEIDFSGVPVFPEAYDMLRAEAVAGGLWTNKAYVAPMVDSGAISDEEMNVLCDPQTSGGLLVALPDIEADRMLASLRRRGLAQAARVGKVLAKGKGRIIVRK
jgi:selenide,water dikinase